MMAGDNSMQLRSTCVAEPERTKPPKRAAWALRHSAVVALLLGSFTLSQAQDATRGRALYMQHQCYSCHGTEGQGGERNAGPAIAPSVTPLPAFELQLRQPRASMPRYNAQAIDADRVRDLYAYVASIPASPGVAAIALLREAMRTP